MARDVAYKLYFGVVIVKVSCRGIMRAIFQKGFYAITLERGQQVVYSPFQDFTLRNLLRATYSWLDGSNGEMDKELYTLYAYLEWMHYPLVGSPKTMIRQ